MWEGHFSSGHVRPGYWCLAGVSVQPTSAQGINTSRSQTQHHVPAKGMMYGFSPLKECPLHERDLKYLGLGHM